MQNLRQVLDSAFVGTLASDSSNIVNLIRDTYNVSVILTLPMSVFCGQVTCMHVCIKFCDYHQCNSKSNIYKFIFF